VKRILFVDGEPQVLEGLRTRLHRLHTKWDMAFVGSGSLAIERMQQQPCDVIVTDMRMPGMDGRTLLEIVNEQWPETIRIVLSGYSQTEQIMRLVPLAHQYLSKPCQPQQLESVIDRCLLLHDLLSEPRLRSLVGRIRALPSLPRIYSALQGIVNDERMTVADVAALVRADSALAARVLQIVNSAFFRLARRITNIEQAVSHLGFQAIRNLAMSVDVFSRWPKRTAVALDLESLQRHVHAVASAAKSLAGKSAIADDTMLAGLLHDIGYWVLVQECPGNLSQAIDLAVARGIPLHAAESEVIGASHAEIGAYLLGIWGLPFPVVEAVAHHHQPARVTQTEFDVLSALVIAHSLTSVVDTSIFAGAIPPDANVDPGYLLAVKAPFDWAEALERVSVTTQSEEVAAR
jgi:HD-like signal output (HDOD) protein/ActR/RegA family two-component response regulator